MSKLKKITIIELRDKYLWRSGDIKKALAGQGVDLYKQTICAWFNGTPPKEENIIALNKSVAILGVEVIFPKK